MNEPKRFTLSFRAALVVYLAIGVVFGIALTMSEAFSWYRIQEMFRFQSMHMYGIIGSAVATAALGLAVLKRAGLRSLEGSEISVPPVSTAMSPMWLDSSSTRRALSAWLSSVLRSWWALSKAS